MHWIVGDVHGCARELEDLLHAIKFDEHQDTLLIAGDLINRGPDSRQVVELWRSVGGRGVIGNHEVYALGAFEARWHRKSDTLQDLFDAPNAHELMASLARLPVLQHLPATDPGMREVWIVHGGLDPRWNNLHDLADELNALPRADGWYEHESISFATRVRCCTADGALSRHAGPPNGCRMPFRPWDAFLNSGALIVHGHWAWRGYYRGQYSLGLDSACVYGGPLTAWCQEEDRIVQVPARTN